ncbi:hypothetical protein N9U40_00170 [Candidatus Pelagibacter sp.]|nr:hypothetical protein [Candidatus Pelagibacter sp.]
MSKENYINIIDFGSSKIRFAVFDNKLNEKFIETNEVIINENYSNHFNLINQITKKAEKKISTHIQDVILALDTKDLFTIDISLKKDLEEKSNLNKIYNNLILELNRLISLYYDKYQILHIVLCQCIVDNKNFIELPKNINEVKNIKIFFKIICFKKDFINFLKNSFKETNLNIKNIFCTSYIKSLSYSQKLGLKNNSFLEIGWERTSLIIFESGNLKFIQSIPIGSFHITKDISKIFKISISEADKIKKSFNKTYTEFSYENKTNDNSIKAKDFINKNISVDLLKKVILFRIQEIIDLTFKSLKNLNYKSNLSNSDLFLIGGGSLLFNNNSFYIDNKFEFRSINFYNETDQQVCNSVLVYHLNNSDMPKKTIKSQGLFEKFFNFFGK